MQMSGVRSHNANITKNQIETAAVKRIMHPQIVKVYVNLCYVYFNMGTFNCDLTADLSSGIT